MTSNKGQCRDAVLNYLVSQNRPYSANDILQNLHNEFGKSAIQKSLDELTAEDKIREKVYGKQKVYSCKQENESEPNECALELGSLDAEIEEALARIKDLEQKVKSTEMELKTLQCEPTTENAKLQLSDLEKTVQELEEKLSVLPESSLTTEDEKEALKRAHDKYSKESKKRKYICMNIIHSILENYPKTINHLLEDIGIELHDYEASH